MSTAAVNRHTWAVAGVGALGLVIVAARAMLRPMEATMPVYLALADRLRQGPVADSFEPLGYAWLISVVPLASADAAAKLLHVVCYVVLVVLVAWHAATLGRGRRGDARGDGPSSIDVGLLSAAIVLHPYVLANITRVNDNNVNVPLAMAVFLFGVSARRGAVGPALLGPLLAAFVAVRPNSISLVPLCAAVALMDAWNRGSSLERWRPAVVMLASGACVYAVLAFVMTGSVMAWPSNGPYNLFAGNNPSSMAALRAEYNAEPSLGDGLAWCRSGEAPAGEPGLARCTARFVAERPLEAITLAGYKFYTLLFRPNLRLADSPLEVIVQLGLVALPLLWWGWTGWTRWTTGRWPDARALWFVLCYAAPFVVTNADPRFRLPLDAVYAISLMRQRGPRDAAVRWE